MDSDDDITILSHTEVQDQLYRTSNVKCEQGPVIDLTADSDDDLAQAAATLLNRQMDSQESGPTSKRKAKPSPFASPAHPVKKPRLATKSPPVASSSRVRLPVPPGHVHPTTASGRASSISTERTLASENATSEGSSRTSTLLTRLSSDVIVVESDEDYPAPMQQDNFDENIWPEPSPPPDESAIQLALYKDGLRRNGNTMRRAEAEIDKVFRKSPVLDPDDYFDEANADFVKPEASARTEVHRQIPETVEYPPDDIIIDQEWHRDEVTERLRAHNPKFNRRSRFTRGDVQAIEAYGKEQDLVASGAICPKLDKWKRSQQSQPSSRSRRPGFLLTGQFTGAKPPPPQLRPNSHQGANG